MSLPKPSLFAEEKGKLEKAGATIHPGQTGVLLTLKFSWPQSEAYFSMGIKSTGSYEVKAFTDDTQEKQCAVGGYYVDIVADTIDEVIDELRALFK
jgi:hypothetical protein